MPGPSSQRKAAEEAASASQYLALPKRQQAFVDEYLKDLNAYQAAKRAGYSPNVAYELLKLPAVQNALKELRDQLAGDRAVEGGTYVLNKLWDIETADPRELVEIWKVPCRYCYGQNGEYQFTKTEMHRLIKAHELGQNQKPFEALWPRGQAEHAAWMAGCNGMGLDTQGGDGYAINRPPNAQCSECCGDGVMLQHVHDTRKLSPQAQALYRGVKFSGKDGKFELILADQAAARDQLAKHYGIAPERKRILVRKLDPNELSDDELIQSLSELEALNASDADYEVIEDTPPPSRSRQLVRPR
jgi:phage terminase small subunit